MSRKGLLTSAAEPPAPGRQRASVSIKLGRRRGFSASVKVTPIGLLAIGGLVSSILLSTAVLVRSAAAAKAAADSPPRLPAPGSRNL
jgi:hypothetical protein